MPYRLLCNDVQREGVKASPDLASPLFQYVPLHKIRYGICEKAPVVCQDEFIFQPDKGSWTHSKTDIWRWSRTNQVKIPSLGF
jgi:hypothetical protein